jgi:TRAP-type C4-dicarboxylate transport system permease small subunit
VTGFSGLDVGRPDDDVAAARGSAALLRPAQKVLSHLNAVVGWLSAIAVVAAGLVLTFEVFVRYIYKVPTDWQDELSVFLLVGATFMSASYVQSYRGHVAIDAMKGVLPPAADRIRVIFADAASLLFCAFFSWKSWTLWHEAWEEGQVTFSSWAPPLWIPYSLMSIGMTLLTLQILVQFLGTLLAAKDSVR